MRRPSAGILMVSDSDLPLMEKTSEVLRALDIF